MTTLPPPPRPIRPTHPHPILKAIGYLIFAGVVAITLVLAGWLLHEVALKVLGSDKGATVASVYERRGPIGELVYVARYSYVRPDGGVRTDESAVSFSARRRLIMPNILAGVAPGTEDVTLLPGAPATIRVRAYAVGGFEFSRALENEWARVYRVGALVLVPAFALLSVALYRVIVILPRRRRRLYTHGAAVPGTVTGKHAYRSRYGYSYSVQYAFTPAGASAPIGGSVMVAGVKEHDAAAPGQVITVLHDLDRSDRNTAYEHGGYRCD